ncbi:hypothetical protein DFH11DRAFT_1546005 [Phellopilus nigrolimitatus]|nr:hypothetical protein DFH11DRAFT_1546005 [Phellopilus nigrolimitatus]
MATNSDDKNNENKQAAEAPERDDTEIVELLGAIVRASLLLILALLRLAQRGVSTVVDSANNGSSGNGPSFSDLRTYLLGGSASQVLTSAGVAAPVHANGHMTSVPVRGVSESASDALCAGPSSAGPYASQKKMRWLEAGHYVSGVTGAIFKGYDSEEEAIEAFNEAVRAGHVRVVPDVNNILNRLGSYTSRMSGRWIGHGDCIAANYSSISWLGYTRETVLSSECKALGLEELIAIHTTSETVMYVLLLLLLLFLTTENTHEADSELRQILDLYRRVYECRL